ncbi:MAG: hypothetical protein LBB23_02125 [Rickettsiales bacterium]|jgi:hypothetical protein|nr:hypothetical protein [Rickettsiales bacterium]
MDEIIVTLSGLMGALGILIAVVRPGKNSQAIRAIGVVSLFAGSFIMGLTAVVWAVLDFFLPNKDKIMAELDKKAGKKK